MMKNMITLKKVFPDSVNATSLTICLWILVMYNNTARIIAPNYKMNYLNDKIGHDDWIIM